MRYPAMEVGLVTPPLPPLDVKYNYSEIELEG
jgi:hypothetical protein